MGVYDVTEVYELYQLPPKYNKNNIGLFRDDGSAAFNNISGSQKDKLRNIFRTYSYKMI